MFVSVLIDLIVISILCFFFFKQKTAYEMRISDWSSDVCSSDLNLGAYFEQIMNALPPSVHDVLTRFGIGDIFSLREKLSAGALQGSKFLAKIGRASCRERVCQYV